MISSKATFAICIFSVLSAGAATVADFQARTYKISDAKSIPYRLFIPKNYSAGKKYPVMLALHGGGERGDNNTAQLTHVFTNFWADDSIQKDNPCFVVAPQCPLNEEWVHSLTFGDYDFKKTPITDNLQAALGILDSLEKEYSIDLDREYVSGMSLGGAGTWYTICAFPNRFAAAIPICGGADTAMAKVLTGIPIWTFHEIDDPTVPVQFTRDMVKAIQAAGGKKLKYTEYPASMGYGHESWKPAAKDPELHKWLFQQVRPAPTLVRGDRKPAIPIADAMRSKVLAVDGLGRVRLENASSLLLYAAPNTGYSRAAPAEERP